MGSVIHVIRPYRYHGLWVFDDPARGLLREAFVAGADTLLDVVSKDFPGVRRRGVLVTFSARPFPQYTVSLAWSSPGTMLVKLPSGLFTTVKDGGNNYRAVELELDVWLCGALLRYFSKPPKMIYVRVAPCGASARNGGRKAPVRRLRRRARPGAAPGARERA